MNAMPKDEYEEERLQYMWFVSYTEDEGNESIWTGRIEMNVPRSDYSRFWKTLQYTHGKDGWISAKKTYDLEEVR